MSRKIGVIDSGVGALTVAKEIQKQLPNDSIIYFGDNGNIPYGNRDEEDIYRLTKRMIYFLIEKENVDIIAVACNTISTLVDKYFKDYPISVVSIIDPVCKYVAGLDIKEVGVIGTTFTINSGEYSKKLRQNSEEKIKVVAEGSAELASLVDSGKFTDQQIVNIVTEHVDNIKKNGDNIEEIVLGCTHYPIVEHLFTGVAPDIIFIDPAVEQVKEIKRRLDITNPSTGENEQIFKLYTTGKKETYAPILDLLDIKEPDIIIELDI